jgi:serine/threonine protein kinase
VARTVRELGRGGMGVVYEAIQEILGRRMALEVLPFHQFLDPRLLERFRREAQTAALL